MNTSKESLYARFLSHINDKGLLRENQKVLLAVSGGKDSMAMTELFFMSPFIFGIAHCNFQLRGKESDQDEQLVKRTAQEKNAPFFHGSFNTKAFARQHKLSVQMAARQLRYEWLEQIRATNGFDLIATAHHLDDSMETIIINLIRGTGISGLKGIPEKNGSVIRPMLFATRDDIDMYISNNGISYREDASNAEDKYLRNKIRHQLIPAMLEINPSLRDSMRDFISRIHATESIYQEAITMAKNTCMDVHKGTTRINIPSLLALSHPQAFLFELLRGFDFSPKMCRDIFSSIDGQAGAKFISNSHTLVRNRHHLIILAADDLPDKTQTQPAIISRNTTETKLGDNYFSFSTGPLTKAMEIPSDPHILIADLDKLSFPLEIRPWKNGDSFVPFGMKGHKKLSDLLVDIKIPIIQKDKVLVLTSEQHIVWVAGIRNDNRFKVTKSTKNYLRVTMSPAAA